MVTQRDCWSIAKQGSGSAITLQRAQSRKMPRAEYGRNHRAIGHAGANVIAIERLNEIFEMAGRHERHVCEGNQGSAGIGNFANASGNRAGQWSADWFERDPFKAIDLGRSFGADDQLSLERKGGQTVTEVPGQWPACKRRGKLAAAEATSASGSEENDDDVGNCH